MRVHNALLLARTVIVSTALLCTLATPVGATVYVDDYGKPITQTQYDALQLMNKGAAFLHAGKNQECLDAMSRAVQMAPELALVQAGYGTALGAVGKYAEAREHLSKALSIDDRNPKAWLALAAINTSMSDNAEALRLYHGYLKKFPNDVNAEKIKSVVALLEQSMAEPSGDASDYYDAACGKDPHRWPADRMPIAVYIAPGAGVKGYRSNFDQIARDSFAEWAAATNGLLKFAFTDSPKDARIVVGWVDSTSAFQNKGMASQCTPYADGATLTGAEIKLLTVDAAAPTILSDSRLKARALKTVGNSLGLLGFSSQPKDIMYASEEVVEHPTLSARDIHTIQKLYGITGNN